MKKENVYLDLSKLSKEEREYIFDIINDRGEFLSLHSYSHDCWKMLNYCTIDERWICSGSKYDGLSNKTEITYSEFIKLFEGVREKSVEEILSDIDYWSTKYEFNFQFWGDSNNNLFITKGGVRMYDNGGLETPKEAILDALKYISRVNPLNSNQ